MFYALSVVVLASPVILAFLLTSKLSRRAKVLIVLGYALLLIIVPITAVALGAGAGA
jgi:hypothetical protein